MAVFIRLKKCLLIGSLAIKNWYLGKLPSFGKLPTFGNIFRESRS